MRSHTKFTTITCNNDYLQAEKSSYSNWVYNRIFSIICVNWKLSAKIDGCKKRGKEDEIAMEERGVLNNYKKIDLFIF